MKRGFQSDWAAVYVLLLLGAAASCEWSGNPAQAPDAGRPILFENADGIRIYGTLHSAARPHSSGLLLVHGVGASRAVWGSYPQRLATLGYTCLALDLAGHGESTADGAVDFRSFSDTEWRARTRDIAAARDALIRAGCDPDDIGILGSGLGAGLSLMAAADGGFASLILLSPDSEVRGVELEPLMRKVNELPILILAGEGDSAAVTAGQTLKASAEGFCEYRMYPGSLHGADLLAGSESAALQVIQWLEQTLPTAPAERAR